MKQTPFGNVTELSDRSILELGMPDSLRVGDALIYQPRTQLGQAPHPGLGPGHLVTQIADLVLDLTLLPTRSGSACHQFFDQMVRARLEKAIVAVRLTHEDRLFATLILTEVAWPQTA